LFFHFFSSFLRGSWLCLPFGAARTVEGLTKEWDEIKWEKSEGEK
jgi:hypothetical protein